MIHRISREVVSRLPSWTGPRIGRLQHHAPKPLRIPASYLRAQPPERAPTITVVTPSFQQGRFLERTIYSILSQEYPRLEYVVQDGASSDRTVDVLHRFGPYLTRWASEPDKGQTDAINRGFHGTTGEIMAWVNSDDLLLPGCLAYVARFLVDHPDVDVIYGYRLMIDEDDRRIGTWITPAHDDHALAIADFVPQETLFWRRRIWDAAGGRVDPSFEYALDWDLLLRFRDAGARMVRLPRFLGAFRVHEAQKTTASHTLGLDECSRLRKRVHGRDLSEDEIFKRMWPYLARHMLAHARQWLVELLPDERLAVRTHPEDSWLHATSLEHA
jgi:GT2 family glycosyltransferase